MRCHGLRGYPQATTRTPSATDIHTRAEAPNLTIAYFAAADTWTYGGVVAFEMAAVLGTLRLPASADMVVGAVNSSLPVGSGAITDWSSTVCRLAWSDVVTTPKLGGTSVGLGGKNGVTAVTLVVGPALAYPVVEHVSEAGSTKPALRAHVAKSSPFLKKTTPRQQLVGPPDSWKSLSHLGAAIFGHWGATEALVALSVIGAASLQHTHVSYQWAFPQGR